MSRFFIVGLVLAALTGCGACGTALDPAPAETDGNFRWIWLHYSDATDPEMADAVGKFRLAIGADQISDPVRGALHRLTPEELAPVQMSGADPSKARGFYIATSFPCTLQKAEEITYALNQDQLYSGTYDAYSRQYTSDFDAYLARKASTLTWDTSIKASILGSSYTEQLHGGMRRLGETSVASSVGPALIVRTWLPSPAQFDPGSSSSFEQDYQLEIYFERSPGQLVHGYALWRQMKIGSLGLTTDNDTTVNTILDNLVKWDQKTAELCAK